MGYNIRIGEFYIDTEDSESHAPSAYEIYDQEAPAFTGSSSIYSHRNLLHATYTAIFNVFEKIGMKNYFTDDPRSQIFGGDAAVIDLTQEIIDRFEEALTTWEDRYPAEWWGQQVLEWFLYWCRFSYRNFKRPVIVAR